MANEVTVPLLPGRSIDEIAAFSAALGFEQTYRQTRPNPYLAVRREDLHLHFFGIPGFVAADSYGSCMVLVEDVGILYDAFAAGMRSVYGKVLVAASPLGRLARAFENAVVLADSHGDHRQAAKILDAELARPAATEDAVALVEALAYRAEIALTLGDRPTAVAMLERVRSVRLSDAERRQSKGAFATIADLTAAL